MVFLLILLDNIKTLLEFSRFKGVFGEILKLFVGQVVSFG